MSVNKHIFRYVRSQKTDTPSESNLRVCSMKTELNQESGRGEIQEAWNQIQETRWASLPQNNNVDWSQRL